jgi:hypothetical protein
VSTLAEKRAESGFMSFQELRKRYKAWWKKYRKIHEDYQREHDRVLKAWEELPLGHPLPEFPPEPPHMPFPAEFASLE